MFDLFIDLCLGNTVFASLAIHFAPRTISSRLTKNTIVLLFSCTRRPSVFINMPEQNTPDHFDLPSTGTGRPARNPIFFDGLVDKHTSGGVLRHTYDTFSTNEVKLTEMMNPYIVLLQCKCLICDNS